MARARMYFREYRCRNSCCTRLSTDGPDSEKNEVKRTKRNAPVRPQRTFRIIVPADTDAQMDRRHVYSIGNGRFRSANKQRTATAVAKLRV
jgi:hypothetical protein